METIVGGCRVIGNNTSNGRVSIWAFPDEAAANLFAEQLCKDTQQLVLVTKLLGVWRPAAPPVEFTPVDKLRK